MCSFLNPLCICYLFHSTGTVNIGHWLVLFTGQKCFIALASVGEIVSNCATDPGHELTMLFFWKFQTGCLSFPPSSPKRSFRHRRNRHRLRDRARPLSSSGRSWCRSSWPSSFTLTSAAGRIARLPSVEDWWGHILLFFPEYTTGGSVTYKTFCWL